jgi:hypothetical protein
MPAAGPPPKACVLPGILTVNDILTDGQNNDFGANQPPDPSVNVRQLFIGEPYTGKLVFTINTGISPAGTPPPQSQWYIIWNKLNPNSNFDRNWVGMKTSTTGAITYEYGNFGVALDPLNPNPNANMAVKVGEADSGSYNPATGEIQIVVSRSKLENIQIGQSMTGMIVRTFLAKDPSQAKAVQSAADTTDPSHYDLVGNAACLEPVPLISIVSRKTHTGVGPFDVSLLSPIPEFVGIECRKGQGVNANQHQVVFTFANPLSSVADASVASQTGGNVSKLSSMIGTDAHEYIVNFTASNAQRLTVTLTGVTDTVGNNTATLPVTIGLLVGDVDASRRVDSTDVFQVRQQSLQTTSPANFRRDIDTSGRIDSTDVFMTRQQSLTSLP